MKDIKFSKETHEAIRKMAEETIEDMEKRYFRTMGWALLTIGIGLILIAVLIKYII